MPMPGSGGDFAGSPAGLRVPLPTGSGADAGTRCPAALSAPIFLFREREKRPRPVKKRKAFFAIMRRFVRIGSIVFSPGLSLTERR